MDLDRFITERQPRWRRLETLLDKAEKGIDARPNDLQELLQLYRQVCSDLNQARTYTREPAVLADLNQLAGRGYRYLYRGGRSEPLGTGIRRFFAERLPAAFRAESRAVLHAAAAMLAGALIGFLAVVIEPQMATDLIPEMFFTESPRERVETIEREDERIDSLEKGLLFASDLYLHNIRVGFLAFSLGALTLVGGYWILLHNGVVLGAVAATYLLDGVGIFFIAWVGPHGALELPAIVFAGAAGIRLGNALLLPGDLSRAESLRQAFPSVWTILWGTMLTLVAAGFIEGSFSQMSAKTVPYALKIGIAALLFGGLLSYLFLPRKRRTA
ncbi:MAG: stage II sporulation protein M [Acidobacteriota bacterium]